jgi:hypothetical protein
MKTYEVTTTHDVYIDNYEDGETKHVNWYQQTSKQKANSPREAIENHFNNIIYLPFNFDRAEPNDENTILYWGALVDENNEQPTAHDEAQWKKGEKELYSNHIEIEIKELTTIKFI